MDIVTLWLQLWCFSAKRYSSTLGRVHYPLLVTTATGSRTKLHVSDGFDASHTTDKLKFEEKKKFEKFREKKIRIEIKGTIVS